MACVFITVFSLRSDTLKYCAVSHRVSIPKLVMAPVHTSTHSNERTIGWSVCRVLTGCQNFMSPGERATVPNINDIIASYKSTRAQRVDKVARNISDRLYTSYLSLFHHMYTRTLMDVNNWKNHLFYLLCNNSCYNITKKKYICRPYIESY